MNPSSHRRFSNVRRSDHLRYPTRVQTYSEPCDDRDVLESWRTRKRTCSASTEKLLTFSSSSSSWVLNSPFSNIVCSPWVCGVELCSFSTTFLAYLSKHLVPTQTTIPSDDLTDQLFWYPAFHARFEEGYWLRSLFYPILCRLHGPLRNFGCIQIILEICRRQDKYDRH